MSHKSSYTFHQYSEGFRQKSVTKLRHIFSLKCSTILGKRVFFAVTNPKYFSLKCSIILVKRFWFFKKNCFFWEKNQHFFGKFLEKNFFFLKKKQKLSELWVKWTFSGNVFFFFKKKVFFSQKFSKKMLFFSPKKAIFLEKSKTFYQYNGAF